MDSLPRDIHIGMKVFDNRHNRIGVVDDFKLSDEDPDREGPETSDVNPMDREGDDSLVGILAGVFDPDDVPQELQDRLLREGYVRIDADGLFAADRYILPEQIASAGEDELRLNVEKSQLIKRH
ncbi:MAG TPA: hypothetical protein VGM83_11795 [Devosiaceae bacterium]|jgi:hypothetical protein